MERRYSFLLVGIFLWMAFIAKAQEMEVSSGVPEHPDEDFVIASILITSPGKPLHSVFGHAALRMQCPMHKLDFVFSQEWRNVRWKTIPFFFLGKIKMRTNVVPTSQYIEQYQQEGRSVREYQLNLPIRVKQRLWQQMDERVERLPVSYDYINRCCAQSVLQWVISAMDADSVEYSSWIQKFEPLSRKDIGTKCVTLPWKAFVLSTIIGGEAHRVDIPTMRKLIIPEDVVTFFQKTKAYNRQLLNDECKEWLPMEITFHSTFITPLLCSCVFFLLSLLNFHLHNRVIRYGILGISTLLGVFVTYLVVFSPLPCTEWNWLIIPFNPLPALLWRWRNRWVLPFTILIGIWAMTMMVYPHQLVLGAHIVLALTLGSVLLEDRYRVKS